MLMGLEEMDLHLRGIFCDKIEVAAKGSRLLAFLGNVRLVQDRCRKDNDTVSKSISRSANFAIGAGLRLNKVGNCMTSF